MLALAIGAMPVLAETGFKVAQQTPESEKDKAKQPAKGQPAKSQPAKGQPPAAKGEPPAAKGQPPAARPQPSTATPSQPPAQPRQAPAATGAPSQPRQGQPAVRGQPPAGQAPAARQESPATQGQPGQRPGERERRPSTAQQPGGQPSGAQTQPATQGQPGRPASQGQPGRPASRDQGKPSTAQQPAQAPTQQPAQTPAAQGQPSTTPAQPGQPQRPATRDQRQAPAAQQGGQPPAAQGQPGQPQRPAGRDQRQRPGEAPPAPATQQAQPPATPVQPPAAQQQPQTQPPAARTRPPGAPAAGQPTATQDKFAPGVQAPRQAVAPPTPPMGTQGQPLRRMEDLRGERREVREGNRIVIREPDRMIIREGGRTIIRHNEVDRFRHGGREVAVDRRGGEVTTVVERPDGTRIVTVVDDNGRLIRRVRRTREGRDIVIIDNRRGRRPDARAGFFVELPPPVIRIPRERYIVEADGASREDIYDALAAPPVERIERPYTLDEVRYSPAVRERMPRVDLDTITFESGSWELTPDQIDRLAVIAEGINRALARDPSEVFLIEGHTDATGPDDENLSLSDRRAETVAVALSEQFQVPAENLTTQGYGEQYLKVATDGPERQNRRVTARRITPLLNGQGSTGQAN
jgi:outer membrane protein OmpA-like peptidoglycan-associated protein